MPLNLNRDLRTATAILLLSSVGMVAGEIWVGKLSLAPSVEAKAPKIDDYFSQDLSHRPEVVSKAVSLREPISNSLPYRSRRYLENPENRGWVNNRLKEGFRVFLRELKTIVTGKIVPSIGMVTKKEPWLQAERANMVAQAGGDVDWQLEVQLEVPTETKTKEADTNVKTTQIFADVLNELQFSDDQGQVRRREAWIGRRTDGDLNVIMPRLPNEAPTILELIAGN
jgi:hypothetical protein